MRPDAQEWRGQDGYQKKRIRKWRHSEKKIEYCEGIPVRKEILGT